MDSIFSFFSFIRIEPLIEYGGLTLVLICVFIETGLLVGLVMPGGESLLFTVGLISGSEILDVNVIFLISFIFLAAFTGDLTGYSIGKKIGLDFFQKKETLFFRKRNLNNAEKLYKKYGISAIILGRFLPFIRTFNPLLAGITGMEFRKFFAVTGFASLLYVNISILAGYFIGEYFPEVRKHIFYIISAILILVVFALLLRFIKEFKRPSD